MNQCMGCQAGWPYHESARHLIATSPYYAHDGRLVQMFEPHPHAPRTHCAPGGGLVSCTKDRYK